MSEITTDLTATLRRLSSEEDDGKLHFFGRDNADLEKQVIAYVLDHYDKPFMQQLLHFIKPELFDEPIGHGLMRVVHEHRENHGVIPTRGELLRYFAENLQSDQADLYDDVQKWVDTKQDYRCYDYLTTTFINDLRHRAYNKALPELFELVKGKQYDEADAHLSRCFPTPDTDACTLDFDNEIDAVIAKDHIQSIGTGFRRLDAVMHEAGAARGEVLVFLANTGVGKTTLLLNCAKHAKQQGLTVLYVVLEGTVKAVAQRFASILANCPTRTIHENQVVVRRAALGQPGKVRFIQPKNEAWTARHITRKVEMLRVSEGFKPDIIIVDYAKMMRAAGATKTDPEYAKIAKIMDEVKMLAIRTDTLVLTAQQANREGEGQDMVGLKHAAGSYDALQPVDYVVSINQTVQEEMRNEMRLMVNKNRHGRESVVIQCQVNRASGLVEEK